MEKLEMLVMVSHPDEFVCWTDKKQLAYYEKALEWHDYIIQLKENKKVTHAWGTQRLISNTRLSPNKSLLVAVYEVDSMDEFSHLITKDPLYDNGIYFTSPLESLEFDFQQDLDRYKKHVAYLESKMGVRGTFERIREPVLKYPYETPWIKKKEKRGEIEILVISTNSTTFIDYTDEQKLDLYEKVMQWHDYNDKLMEADIVTRVWTSHQFCDIARFEGRVANATQIFNVDTFEEFDTIFAADPVRSYTRFWTVWLTSLETSIVRTKGLVGNAKRRC